MLSMVNWWYFVVIKETELVTWILKMSCYLNECTNRNYKLIKKYNNILKM